MSRVHDIFADRYGTAVQHFGRNVYRVEWDEPTPHQGEARVKIPSRFFKWVTPYVWPGLALSPEEIDVICGGEQIDGREAG